jgi:hypothetical protein
MDALIAEQGELQEKIEQAGAWDLDRTVEIAMDALHWCRSTSKRAGASESWPVPPPEAHGPRLSQRLCWRTALNQAARRWG